MKQSLAGKKEIILVKPFWKVLLKSRMHVQNESEICLPGINPRKILQKHIERQRQIKLYHQDSVCDNREFEAT